MRAIVCVLALAACAYCQVSNYLKGDANNCPSVLVVKPAMDSENIGRDLEPEDFQTSSSLIGDAIAQQYDNCTVISVGDLPKYEKCNCFVMVAKVKSYVKEPARMGQWVGNLTVEVLTFDSPRANKPNESQDFQGNSGRTWGSSGPFRDASDAVAKDIRRHLE